MGAGAAAGDPGDAGRARPASRPAGAAPCRSSTSRRTPGRRPPRRAGGDGPRPPHCPTAGRRAPGSAPTSASSARSPAAPRGSPACATSTSPCSRTSPPAPGSSSFCACCGSSRPPIRSAPCPASTRCCSATSSTPCSRRSPVRPGARGGAGGLRKLDPLAVAWPEERELERLLVEEADRLLGEEGIFLPGLARALAERARPMLETAREMDWAGGAVPVLAPRSRASSTSATPRAPFATSSSRPTGWTGCRRPGDRPTTRPASRSRRRAGRRSAAATSSTACARGATSRPSPICSARRANPGALPLPAPRPRRRRPRAGGDHRRRGFHRGLRGRPRPPCSPPGRRGSFFPRLVERDGRKEPAAAASAPWPRPACAATPAPGSGSSSGRIRTSPRWRPRSRRCCRSGGWGRRVGGAGMTARSPRRRTATPATRRRPVSTSPSCSRPERGRGRRRRSSAGSSPGPWAKAGSGPRSASPSGPRGRPRDEGPDRVAAEVLGRVVAITFTEAAAAEMAGRAARELAALAAGHRGAGLARRLAPAAGPRTLPPGPRPPRHARPPGRPHHPRLLPRPARRASAGGGRSSRPRDRRRRPSGRRDRPRGRRGRPARRLRRSRRSSPPGARRPRLRPAGDRRGAHRPPPAGLPATVLNEDPYRPEALAALPPPADRGLRGRPRPDRPPPPQGGAGAQRHEDRRRPGGRCSTGWRTPARRSPP